MKSLLLCFSLFANAGMAATSAHEFHTTLMTIEHNVDERNLEITLRIFTHDLQPTLERRLNRKIDLGSTKGLDAEVFEYIDEKFSVKTKAGERLTAKWVGKEMDAQVAYYFFEIPFEGDLEGASITNTLFFERFPEQINYVTVRSGENKSDLVFKVGDKAKPIVTKFQSTHRIKEHRL